MEPTALLRDVNRIYSFWGRHPRLYAAQDFLTFLGRPRLIRKSAVSTLALQPGGRVLEVACGSGRNLGYLREAVGTTGKVVGFDYSQEMLRAAGDLSRRKKWRNVRLERGDAAVLALNERNFDGVISILGTSAIPGWREALARCHDLLRPGGKMVVCDARLFTRSLSWVNRVVEPVYRRFAAWDPTKDIPTEMHRCFGNVVVKNMNFDTFYIASSVKGERP